MHENLHHISWHNLRSVPSVVVAMLLAVGAQEWLLVILQSKLAATVGAAVITVLFNVWRYINQKDDGYKEKYIAALEAQVAANSNLAQLRAEAKKPS